MEDLEKKLKTLPLRKPPQELDRRVQSCTPRSRSQSLLAGWRVSLWGTVAASAFMAVFGFLAGVVWQGVLRGGNPEAAPATKVIVIYNSPSSTNPFDFTRVSEDHSAEVGESNTPAENHTSI